MEIEHELHTVIIRMHDAGWPEPADISDIVGGQANWQNIIEALAERYLRSIDLRVATLIQLGPLAATNLPLALDLAGWEGETAVHADADDVHATAD